MMNELPLFATAYLPPIIYFAYLQQFNRISIEQYETFPKQTYRNRTLIVTANGPLVLSVPVIRPFGNHTATKDIKISHQERWNIRHWRAIESAYNTSPYFLYYKDDIEKIILSHQDSLLEMNHLLMTTLLKQLKIDCEITYTNDFIPERGGNDYRFSITPKKPASPTLFPPYCQVFDSQMSFLPNMSILDLLFNVGPDSKRYLTSIVSRETRKQSC